MPFARLDEVVAEVTPLAERFVAAGKRTYLVGGIVRDLYLDRNVDGGVDIDLTTDAAPDETKAILSGWAEALWTQGERFGTIGAIVDGRAYEITTHRSEFYAPASRKPAVRFTDSIEADLSRRDFTVNAMALSVPSATLVDPFGGATDLGARRLRTPLAPEVSFSDDPLRMLRAARFVAGYELVPDNGLVAAIREIGPRLAIVSAERIRDELDKLLAVRDPTRGLELLFATAIVGRFAPELEHHADDVVALVAAAPVDAQARLAALFYPAGPAAGERLEALRYRRSDQAAVDGIHRAARQLVDGAFERTDAWLRRWRQAAGPWAGRALLLARAAGAPAARVAWAERRLEELGAVEDLDDLGSPLDGAAVQDLLGIGQGPEVGAALSYLAELRLDHGPIGRDEAAARLVEWWRSR